MLKLLVPIVVLVIIATTGFFWLRNQESKPTPTPSPIVEVSVSPQPASSSPQSKSDPCEVLVNGSADVPLLQVGIIWEKPVMTAYDVPITEGTKKMNGCLIKSDLIEFNKASEIRNKYAANMTSKEWINISSSDLPGESGSDTWFNKQKEYLLLEISPAEKPNVEVIIFYSN